MTINERIKYLRKNIFSLSQTEFSERLQLSQRSVSRLEQDGNGITDQTIKLICVEFGINEMWLRNGQEPIFAPNVPTISLEEYVASHGGSELELRFLKAYLDLDPEIRETVINHFMSRLTSQSAANTASGEPTTEELEEEYKKSRLNSVSKTTSSASNTIADTRAENA